MGDAVLEPLADLANRRPDAGPDAHDRRPRCPPLRLAFLRGKIANWWLPDEVVFVDEIPHTATGKIQKTALRERFRNFVLPGVAAVS